MGWLSDKMFGKKKKLDLDTIRGHMSQTQGLVDDQLGMSRQMMDPNSALNMQMRNMLAQRAAQTGAQTGQQMMRMGAMSNVSPGQAMMQARMAQNQAMGQANQQWQNQLEGRFTQGLGLMGSMTGMQQGLDENMANAYIGQINAANAQRNQRMGMTMGLLGSIAGAAGTALGGS